MTERHIDISHQPNGVAKAIEWYDIRVYRLSDEICSNAANADHGNKDTMHVLHQVHQHKMPTNPMQTIRSSRIKFATLHITYLKPLRQ
jgi:hypothetical protein